MKKICINTTQPINFIMIYVFPIQVKKGGILLLMIGKMNLLIKIYPYAKLDVIILAMIQKIKKYYVTA